MRRKPDVEQQNTQARAEAALSQVNAMLARVQAIDDRLSKLEALIAGALGVSV